MVENILFRLRGIKNRKGQAGPIGEDVVSMLVMVLMLSIVVLIVISAIAHNSRDSRGIDMYRTAIITADYLATKWAWRDSSGVLHSRVLDSGKICGETPSLDSYTLGINVSNTRTGHAINCGYVEEGTVIRLPVSIKYQERFDLGILEVRVGR